MRSVEVIADISSLTGEQVFHRLCDFPQYQRFADVVLDLQVVQQSDRSSVSNWKVKIGPGTACWSQRDTIDQAAKTIRFDRLEGDIDAFSGQWNVRDTGSGCAVAFSVEFDTGLFLLAGVVEPMIAKLLRENIASIISGLFGTAASVHGQPE